MDYQNALSTLAEVAIAITGFAGVVAVFGRRSSGDWERCADALARIGTSSAIQLLANLAQSKNAELATVCGAAFVSSRKEGS